MFLKSKIHRAVVTDADLHYEGSLTIGRELMEASGLVAFERIEVFNIANGERFATYAIEGETGAVKLNGAAAWKGKVGDRVIIVSYCSLEPEELRHHRPQIIRVGENNSDFASL